MKKGQVLFPVFTPFFRLFLRSAFVSQKQPKNLPDLGGATKGEKKALFRLLGGLDYLQMYADNLKDCVKILNEEINAENIKIEEYERLIEKKQELEASLDKLGNLVRKEGELNEKRTKTLQEREQFTTEHANQKEAVANTLAEIQAAKTEAEKSLQAVRHEGEKLLTEANLLDREISENPLTENCCTCGQRLNKPLCQPGILISEKIVPDPHH